MTFTIRGTIVLAILAAACGGGAPDVKQEDLGVAHCRPEARCGRIGPEQYCANLSNDERNCGACGNVCRSGEVCLGGGCQIPCGDGLAACEDETHSYCTDVNTDEANCGECRVACAPSDHCANGDCLPACPDAELPNNCGTPDAAACVNVLTDADNCGACGRSCPVQHACVEGACTLICDAAETRCVDAQGVPYCADTQTDAANCGGCGEAFACADGRACVAGACALPCDAPLFECGGSCVDRDVDPNHCGACGNACGQGYSCVSGACRLECPADRSHCGEGDAQYCADTTSDGSNCGGCGNACGRDQTCINANCVCSVGQLCNGVCVDKASDPNNCGECGVTCSSALEPVCVEGHCEADPAATSYLPAVTVDDSLRRTYASMTFRSGAAPGYWATVGFGSTTNLASYDAATFAPTGTLVTSRIYRSIFTAGGSGARIFVRTSGSPSILEMLSPGVFQFAVNLNGAPTGTLATDGSVSLTVDGAYYVTQNGGVLSLWSATTGTWAKTVTLEGFGTDPAVPNENVLPASVRVAVARDKYLTYSGGKLSIWTVDAVTGIAQRRVVTLVDADPFAYPMNDFSLSYANDYVFVNDYMSGVWRGYRVGGL